ncbi:MAG: GGDEF domain-containing protein [Candidatus Omnitrophica bacterium]|nr:GGDEF domain-containing protein [Candidatus Omnitrophota bacterium]
MKPELKKATPQKPHSSKDGIRLEKSVESMAAMLHLIGVVLVAALGVTYLTGKTLSHGSVGLVLGFFVVSSMLSLVLFLKPLGFFQLRKRVAYDKLTAILDRGSFHEKLGVEIRRAARYHFPLTVCLLDVDDFEELTRKNGKYYGDEILQKFAQIALSHIRSSDLVGRAGRDEFLILLSHTDLNQAEKFLYRLYLQIQERLDHSFSAGITSYRPGESAQDMLKRSEQALERAQQEGQRKTRCLICKDDSRVVMNFDFGKMPG